MPDVTIPPALDRIVVSGGDGTLVNVMVKTPVANGITGPISPVNGCPVAGLIVGLSPFGPARVANNRTPGMKSLASMTRRALASL